jgi:trk system potassium uptake protein TrkH
LVESIGALLLYLHWRINGVVPAEQAIFYAIFHAISAFCNAGFDLFAGLPAYPNGIPNDPMTLLIMGGLVIVGGLGIPVLVDLLANGWRPRLSLHTRMTLVVSVGLILLGWTGLLLSEYFFGGLLADSTNTHRLVTTWFQSVSSRTAGFPGLQDFDQLQPDSQLLVMALMFIGSAPASMGGGITTGTFAVLMVSLFSFIRGRSEARVGGRTISAGTVRRAGAVLTISLTVIVVATWLILAGHNVPLGTVLFEVVSAFATCGLSLGLTGELNTLGRLVIIVMMFWGRLGALTIVLAIWQRQTADRLVSYPEESVLIG